MPEKKLRRIWELARAPADHISCHLVLQISDHSQLPGDSATEDEWSRNLSDLDHSALSRSFYETQQSWLLGPGKQKKKKKYVDLGCVIVSRKIFVWTLGALLACGLAGFVTLIVKTVPRHYHRRPPSFSMSKSPPSKTPNSSAAPASSYSSPQVDSRILEPERRASDAHFCLLLLMCFGDRLEEDNIERVKNCQRLQLLGRSCIPRE